MFHGKNHEIFARFALPQMIGLLFNSVYIIVDGVFIGNVLGRDAMAAAAVSVPLVEMLIALSMVLASGSGVMIAGALGRDDRKGARYVFNVVIVTAAGIGLLIALFGNAFIHQLAVVLGSMEAIHDQAVTYMRYILTLSPFMLYSFLLGGLARNDGQPRLAMVAMVVGSLSNVFLDWLFMVPLHMGIGGAALATAVGPVISVIILLPHFLKKRGALYFEKFRLKMRFVGRILMLGFPSFVMEFTIGMITFVYNAGIVRSGYGEVGLAAYLIIGYLMLMILTLFLGMAEGLQPVFSHFTGTNEPQRNRSMYAFSVKVFAAVSIACYALVLVGSRAFYTIFNPEDLELIEFAATRSVPYFCGFVFAGYNILTISYWQATQRTAGSLAVSLMRSAILPPLMVALLPVLMGAEGIWLGHSVSEALTAVFAVGLFALARKRGAKKES